MVLRFFCLLVILKIAQTNGSLFLNKLQPQPFLQPQNKNDSRIVGGISTTIQAHPHQVSLLYFHSHICGGSLISTRWVVSAAHCTQLRRLNTTTHKLSIRLGSSFRNRAGTIMAVSRIMDHPLFWSLPYDYDITLIQMHREVRIDNTIRPISLPPLQTTYPRPGIAAVVTGWGSLSSGGPIPDVLQEVTVPVVSQTTCQDLYDQLPFENRPIITDRMICAGFMSGGFDSCQGDSGGPLIIGNQLYGVVSWGYYCAFPAAPGVYASVPSVRQWIQDVSGL